jgi:hypothetical protein
MKTVNHVLDHLLSLVPDRIEQRLAEVAHLFDGIPSRFRPAVRHRRTVR